MKITLKELLELLHVHHGLTPYETVPFSAYNADKGLTCSAEVRTDGTCSEIEAEIQFVRDNPTEGAPAIEQLFYLHAKPSVQDKWAPDILRFRKEIYTGKFYDWEKKGCEFFSACVTHLMRNEIPDIDDLAERLLKGDNFGGTGGGGGGNRKPTIRPEQLLNPTRRGF